MRPANHSNEDRSISSCSSLYLLPDRCKGIYQGAALGLDKCLTLRTHRTRYTKHLRSRPRIHRLHDCRYFCAPGIGVAAISPAFSEAICPAVKSRPPPATISPALVRNTAAVRIL